jgi:hypothetical protein
MVISTGSKAPNALRGTETRLILHGEQRKPPVAKHLMPCGALKLATKQQRPVGPLGPIGSKAPNALRGTETPKPRAIGLQSRPLHGSKAPNALRGSEGQSPVLSPWPGESLRDVAARRCRRYLEFRISTEMTLTWWSGCGMLDLSHGEEHTEA